MKFFKVSLFLITAISFSEIFPSVRDNKLLQPQQISSKSKVKDKFIFLYNVKDQQTEALKQAEEIPQQRNRLDEKIRIALNYAAAVIQTADISTKSGKEIEQRAQNFMKDDKDQAAGLQSLYLNWCYCCPERDFKELPTRDYVEKGERLVVHHLLNLHAVKNSQKISKQDRS